jgi:Protein of unknown function (DUF3168)
MVKAVTYILENNATVQGIIGQNAAADKYKVYPVIVPQSEKEPYLVVRQASKVATGKGCSSYDYSVEVLSYHTTYDDVTTLAEAVRSALEGQATTTVNGVDFGFLNFTNEVDSFSVEHGNLYVKVLTFEGASN